MPPVLPPASMPRWIVAPPGAPPPAATSTPAGAAPALPVAPLSVTASLSRSTSTSASETDSASGTSAVTVALQAPEVLVGGLRLAVRVDAGRDLEAIPAEPAAGWVNSSSSDAYLRVLALAWQRGRAALLSGPTGCGKTAAVRHLAHLTGTPFRRINLSAQTDISDLLGRLVLVPGGTPAWEDGPLLVGMRRGEVVLLDEANLCPSGVLERLHPLFDDEQCLTLSEDGWREVRPDPQFRLFATLNPADTHPDRHRWSRALCSRWYTVRTAPPSEADFRARLQHAFPKVLPRALQGKLVRLHGLLSSAAERGELGAADGGVAYTWRDLQRVARRFVHFRDGNLGHPALLLRRESQAVYLGSLNDPRDRQSAAATIDLVMPLRAEDQGTAAAMYNLTQTPNTLNIYDQSWPRLQQDSRLVPPESARLISTPRTDALRYAVATALSLGENVLLVGSAASSKTALVRDYCAWTGQGYLRQTFGPDTDVEHVIGDWSLSGWRDGALVHAARHGYVYVADEPNLSHSGIVERLNSALDDERALVLAEKDGERVPLHPNTRVVATMNPVDADHLNRNPLSPALRNRFTQIQVPELDDPDEHRLILQGRCRTQAMESAQVDALVDLHARICAGFAAGQEIGLGLFEPPILTLRQLIELAEIVAERLPSMSFADALSLAVESQYVAQSPADREVLLSWAAEAVPVTVAPLRKRRRQRRGDAAGA